MIDISAGTFRTFVDHGVMIAAVEAALASNPPGKNVPFAVLRAIGSDLLHAAAGDIGAQGVRWDWRRTDNLAKMTATTAFHGAIPINAMALAAMMGRGDLADRFRERGCFSTEAALQWLILHGVCEHRLWHFVDGRLRQALLRPVVHSHLTLMPGLGALVLRERPDLARRFIKRRVWQADAFRAWLRDEGLDTYRLFWLVPPSDLDGWEMRGWHTHPMKRPPNPSQLSIEEASRFQVYGDGAIRAHLQEFEAWQTAQRPDVVTQMRPFSAAAQLLTNCHGTPSKDGWLTFKSGGFSIISPLRQRGSPFAMVEMILPDGAAEWSAAASWGNVALPIMLHRSSNNCCVIMRLPPVPNHGAIGVLHVEVSDLGGNSQQFDLIRFWNL